MKKKNFTASTCALALVLTLTACGTQGGTSSSEPPPAGSGGGSPAFSSASLTAPDPSAGSVPAPAVKPSSAPDPSGASASGQTQKPQEQGSAMAKAYRKALESICNDHLYPNGDPVEVPEWAQMENNSFAILDVDGDGEEELIYQNRDSTMAGMTSSVYGFDPYTGELYLELSGFVAMTFYDNGIIRVEASHNHGLSARDDFWPFSLYRYDASGDGYLMAGYADAWDKEAFPADYDGSPFPDEADRDGDGLIYLITSGGQEVTAGTLDGPDYQKWLDANMAGAAELEIFWQGMTQENIQAVSP